MSEKNVVAVESLFSDEDVLKHIPKWRWLKVNIGSYTLLNMNWVVTGLASIILLVFIILGAADPDAMIEQFKVKGQPWVTQNFTWLYIITQDVWVAFLIWLAVSKYGSLKLGKDNEIPKYNDLSWFCMLFCCGIAVGFFFFGVGEPLYYYRQPSYWKGWDYDYNLRKIQVNDDDQRAMQSIFMCYFHWGVHGWIPYVLIACNAGIVSHRWGLPMTIRACFYPLIGDHIFSFIGDFIDSVSMACTTFGVCTSLGLGAMQLTDALVYMQREFSTAEQLADPDFSPIKADSDTYAGLIIGITTVSTISVVSGLNHGLKYLSMLAMVICLIILFFCMMADNTAYILNIYVQSIGFYLQYVIQAGFDCEAFQQLTFEYSNNGNFYPNLLWGSTPHDLAKRLGNAMTNGQSDYIPLSSADCGTQANPCSSGSISAHFFDEYAGGMAGGALAAVGMSASSIAAAAAWAALHPGAREIPCGSLTNSTHYTAEITAITGPGTGNAIAAKVAAADTMDTAIPSSCPTTTFDNVASWGSCSSHSFSCTFMQAKYDSTNRMFMDWWTVFYWGWWVSWGPFVGVFIATISRGRTIRQVVVGAFVLPCIFCFLWFACFGGLAVKMQRTAEYALGAKPDWHHGTIDCDTYYDRSGNPITAEAQALDTIGYRMIACQPFVTQIYDIMRPYQEYKSFLWLCLWVGLFFYFITSSDSGSFVDDLLGSSGMSNPPAIQKIYWCWTEGLTAIILVTANADNIKSTLKGLRSVSICSGFPLTIMMCLMVPAIWRSVKREFGEEDILTSKKFNTQLFDFAVGFSPKRKGPYHGQMGTYLVKTGVALVAPGFSIFKSLSKVSTKASAIVLGFLAQVCWLLWFIFHIVDAETRDSHALAWTCFFFMVGICGYTRYTVRGAYNVWGGLIEDYWCAFAMYPFVLAQAELATDNDNAEGPAYFADLDGVLGAPAPISSSSSDVKASSA